MKSAGSSDRQLNCLYAQTVAEITGSAVVQWSVAPTGSCPYEHVVNARTDEGETTKGSVVSDTKLAAGFYEWRDAQWTPTSADPVIGLTRQLLAAAEEQAAACP